MAQPAQPVHPAAIEHIPGFINGTRADRLPLRWRRHFSYRYRSRRRQSLFSAARDAGAHGASDHKVQMEIVAVLALISLFTHNHLFWIAGLLLALIAIPDFSTPMNSIAESLEKLAGT